MLSIHNIGVFFYIKLKSPELSNTLIQSVRWHQKDKMPKAIIVSTKVLNQMKLPWIEALGSKWT